MRLLAAMLLGLLLLGAACGGGGREPGSECASCSTDADCQCYAGTEDYDADCMVCSQFDDGSWRCRVSSSAPTICVDRR